jgi:hypothetical protein
MWPLQPWVAIMPNERRRHHRYVINRMAKLQIDTNTLPRECMIVDLSKQGARLFAESVHVPDRFHLLISGTTGGGDRRECQVVWRLGGEIGVTFTRPALRETRAASR